MIISRIKNTLMNRYSGSSYMVQQKAFVLFAGSITLLCVVIPFAIDNLIKLLAPGFQINYFFISNSIFSGAGIIFASISIFLLWRGGFTAASYMITIFLTFGSCLSFFSGYDYYIKTGYNNQNYFFYAIMLLAVLFDSKKILISIAAVFLVSNLAIYLIAMTNIDPSVSRAGMIYSVINSNIALVIEALILYLYISITNRSLGLTEIELQKNRELMETLEQKVNERTYELSAANGMLNNLGENLKKYLPQQLVDSIIKGDKDAAVETERKKLTIMFSDIKGFTEATDGMEPEELSSMLNEYLSDMTAIAHRWGGTVDKFIGDAIMIFFGAPESTNDRDHALRCVKMAIEMQKRMKILQKKWFDEGIEYSLEIRIGINTGVAAVGNFGTVDRLSYTAIGGHVNLASRLETICEPGGILISHPAYALVKDEIPCRQKGQIHVKGIHREILVYEVALDNQ